MPSFLDDIGNFAKDALMRGWGLFDNADTAIRAFMAPVGQAVEVLGDPLKYAGNFSGAAAPIRQFARDVLADPSKATWPGAVAATGRVMGPRVLGLGLAAAPAVAGAGVAYGLDALGANPVYWAHRALLGETAGEMKYASAPEHQFGPAMGGTPGRMLLGHIRARLHIANQDPLHYTEHMNHLRGELQRLGYTTPEIVSLYRDATGDHLTDPGVKSMDVAKWGGGADPITPGMVAYR